ncbi:hypothetical protein FA15DRAFT_548877, partial [Coprinopsis marcescibilis]
QVTPHLIRNVLYILSAPNCLLLLSQFDDVGSAVTFENGECKPLIGGGKVVGTGRKLERLYQLNSCTELRLNKVLLSAARAKLTWDNLH